MNDIFISYESADRATAETFADALESYGWSVWWDREIPFGKTFDQVIEEELNAARCVIVLWSKESARSRWVKTEAAAAADRECLIPVLIEDTAIPFEFRRIQTAMLLNWRGDAADSEFKRVIEAAGQMLGRPPPGRVITPARAEVKRHVAPGRPAVRISMIAVAAIFAAIAGAIAVWNLAPKADPSPRESPASGTTHSENMASSASSPVEAAGSRKSNPPRGAFSIKIGDKIGDGVPAAGAGSIEAPYSQDVYVFNAAAKQRVYFRKLHHSAGMSYIKWRLTDANGMEIFNTCLGCTEVGVQTLSRGGTYTLTVGHDTDPATGTYELQLFDVPAPDRLSTKIGDAIKENMPGPGAAAIESPGAQDVYSFTAKPRQRVYFRASEHSPGLSYIRWKLTDENGMAVFDTCLGCGDPGVHTLIKGGTYTLTVGHDNDPSTGAYRLQLYDVPPPNQFTIKIGDKVRPGVPGAGAGAIESPGAEDIYVFTATQGQRPYFKLLEHDKGMEYIRWSLADSNGMKLFDVCLACGDPGVRPLTLSGTYTLTVGNKSIPASGNYTFETGWR